MVSIWSQLETAKLFMLAPLWTGGFWPAPWKIELTILYKSKPPFRSLTPFIILLQMRNYENLTTLHLAAIYMLLQEAKDLISLLAEVRYLSKAVLPQSISEYEESFYQWFSNLSGIRGT